MRKREILGLLFLVIGASGVFLSVRQAPPQYVYLTASRDISSGEIVKKSDFSRESLYLSSSATRYISANAKVSGHRALRSMSKGELVPRDSLTSQVEVEERHLLTFKVSQSESPQNLTSGDVIDIYFFSVPSSGVIDERVELVKIIQQIKIQDISIDKNRMDDRLTISALFDKDESEEVMTLITQCKISISQRFDNGE